jgi:hypothetical protein
LGDGMAVGSIAGKGLQNQEIEGALKKVHMAASLSSRVSTYSIAKNRQLEFI